MNPIEAIKKTILATLLVWTLSCCQSSAANGFVFGVFDKYDDSEAGSKAWREHYVRLAGTLSDHHINGVVLASNRDPAHSLELLDLMQKHDIRVLQTIGNPLSRQWDMAGPQFPFHQVYSHDAVLAYKYADEPKTLDRVRKIASRYDAISRYYSRPIVTALIGELMEADDEFSRETWSLLDSDIKFARFYGMRREYELFDWYEDKTRLDFVSWCRMMESAHGDAPWWFIAQTFGRGKQKNNQSYWRLPTNSEMNAQLHTALAFGARGIWGFALQPFGNPKNVFMLDRSFEPVLARDGSVPFEAFTAVAKKISQHEQFYLNHVPAEGAVEVSGENVVAVPRRLEGANGKFLYLVNLQGEQTVRITLPTGFFSGGTVTDILSGTELNLENHHSTGWLELVMGAGEARVLTSLEEPIAVKTPD